MTEDEAKEKFCHLSLSERPRSYCEGSLCMAWRWRWETDWPPQHQMYTMMGGKIERPKAWQTQHGYCGLAGQPETQQ